MIKYYPSHPLYSQPTKTYQGETFFGVRDGYGSLVTEGYSFVGEFQMGEFHKGSLVFTDPKNSDGVLWYTGSFKNGFFHGDGVQMIMDNRPHSQR